MRYFALGFSYTKYKLAYCCWINALGLAMPNCVLNIYLRETLNTNTACFCYISATAFSAIEVHVSMKKYNSSSGRETNR